MPQNAALHDGVPPTSRLRTSLPDSGTIVGFLQDALSVAGYAGAMNSTTADDSIWRPRPPGTVPTAVLVSMTQDVAIRRFAEQAHRVVRWTETDRGGHFMAHEEPEQVARRWGKAAGECTAARW